MNLVSRPLLGAILLVVVTAGCLSSDSAIDGASSEREVEIPYPLEESVYKYQGSDRTLTVTVDGPAERKDPLRNRSVLSLSIELEQDRGTFTFEEAVAAGSGETVQQWIRCGSYGKDDGGECKNENGHVVTGASGLPGGSEWARCGARPSTTRPSTSRSTH
jgi:hypothetical protein